MLMTEFHRYENESEDELIYRIGRQKDLIGSWQDVANVLNKLLNYNYSESAYRKKIQYFQKMFEANEKLFVDIEEQKRIIREEMRELEQAKVQFRDERNEWSKQNRISGRVADKLDKLEEAVLTSNRVLFEVHNTVDINSDNDMLVFLSDLHIGQCFSSNFGEYNTDIAKERLEKYLTEIIKIQKRHNSENCYITLQGDMISNSIHKALAITNRENVIEQIKIASEFISSFCYELTKIFSNVYMVSVVGNHSRIDRKDDALHDERLDDLISWNVKMFLSKIKNFKCLDVDKIDNGIGVIDIRGKKYISVHGDYDAFNKQGVSNLVLMIGYLPYAILYGHLHTCALDETSGIKMVRSGSLAGSGDDYTNEKRLRGKASQMVCVCNANGIECLYPIELN